MVPFGLQKTLTLTLTLWSAEDFSIHFAGLKKYQQDRNIKYYAGLIKVQQNKNIEDNNERIVSV